MLATQYIDNQEFRILNTQLENQTAEQRVAWCLGKFGKKTVMTSSFGAQAAVCLHLATTQWPEIPVILIDTGYLFPETYRFVDDLTTRLQLNLQVFRPAMTAGWMEAKYGKLWEQGEKGLQQYGEIVKVEPLRRALQELGAEAWITGLRRQQSSSRQNLEVLATRGTTLKVHPLIDWTDRDVFRYLSKHKLPYHPLWDQGYVSIGDWHSTKPLTEGLTEEETRFGGVKRECGLHDPVKPDFAI